LTTERRKKCWAPVITGPDLNREQNRICKLMQRRQRRKEQCGAGVILEWPAATAERQARPTAGPRPLAT
jgi:hypothetical protein